MMDKPKRSAFGVIFIALFGLSGCVGGGSSNGSWQNLSEEEILRQEGKAEQTIFIFYRDQEDMDPRRINVFVDGYYQTTLHQNMMSSVVLCAKNNRVGVAYDNTQDFDNKAEEIQLYNLNQKNIYFKLSAKGVRPQIEIINENIAREEVRNLKNKPQTLSRVPAPKNCN